MQFKQYYEQFLHDDNEGTKYCLFRHVLVQKPFINTYPILHNEQLVNDVQFIHYVAHFTHSLDNDIKPK